MDLFRKKSVDQLVAESTPLKRTMRTFDLTMLGIGAIGALRTMNRGPRYANDFWITDMPDAVAGAREEILLRS